MKTAAIIVISTFAIGFCSGATFYAILRNYRNRKNNRNSIFCVSPLTILFITCCVALCNCNNAVGQSNFYGIAGIGASLYQKQTDSHFAPQSKQIACYFNAGAGYKYKYVHSELNLLVAPLNNDAKTFVSFHAGLQIPVGNIILMPLPGITYSFGLGDPKFVASASARIVVNAGDSQPYAEVGYRDRQVFLTFNVFIHDKKL